MFHSIMLVPKKKIDLYFDNFKCSFLGLRVHIYRTDHGVYMLYTQKNIRNKNKIRNSHVFENYYSREILLLNFLFLFVFEIILS